jgi:putative transposase
MSGRSAAAHLGLSPAAEILDMAFAASAGGRERWAALLAEPEELIAMRALQRGTFTGRPVGDAAFVKGLEDQLGRPLAPRQGQRRDLLELVAGA